MRMPVAILEAPKKASIIGSPTKDVFASPPASISAPVVSRENFKREESIQKKADTEREHQPRHRDAEQQLRLEGNVVDLQDDEGRQGDVDDERVERNMCAFRQPSRGAKTHAEKEADEQQNDIIH